MSSLIPFSFESHPIRAFNIDGNPWLVGKDVCDVLGYANATDAIKQHCRGVAKYYPIVDRLGRTQKVRIINEPDTYRLITGSTLPEAERFEKWTFEEVLPTIRKTGSYALPFATPALPDATITPAQQGILYQLALSRAGDRTIRAAVWARFSKHFSLNSYKNLPSSRFDEAVAYLESLQIEAKRKAIAAPADHQAALQQIKAAVAVLEVVPAAPAVIVKPGPAPVVRKQEPRTMQELSFVGVDKNGKINAWAVEHDYAEEIWNDGVELGHDYAEEVQSLAKHNEGEAYKALFLTLSGRKMGASGGPWGPVPGNETWIAGRGQEDGFADAIASLAVIGLRTLREMPEPTDRLHNPMFRLHGRK